MPELNDHELLDEFARTESEAAFATLVARYVNLVHSTALRFTGNPHHAEEITQAVFIILARKAGKLSPRVVLSGWLYQAARLTAANFAKSEIRRQHREQEAYMQTLLNEPDPMAWKQIAPLLDDAMGGLSETDRNAVVLYFFENKTAAEVATALKLTEAAAHKRVSRALEKLRNFLTKRGVSSTTASIAGAIAANSVQAAPATLVKTITAVALAKGATASISTLTLVKAVTIKSAATFGAGSMGGLFATIGSAYVSLKARADDSKSPRERQFMVRMFRMRAAVYLLWMALYVVATKCDFFQAPICFDFSLAAFVFYFFCIDLLILAREQNLRRRQIQIEDHTYMEAEWTMPRKVTDPTTGPVNIKNILRALRFWIFGLIFTCTIWFQLGGAHALYQGWKVRSQHPVAEVCLIISLSIAAASLAMAPYTRFLQWQKYPRFMPIRGDGSPPRGFVVFPIMFPIVIGLLTLAIFDIYQCLANDGLHDSPTLASPAEVLVFNLVIVLVYTAFTIRTIGILARRRKYSVDKKS